MGNNQDCIYLIDSSSGINKSGTCKITNQPCGLIRYCTTKNKVVSSELYHISGCRIEKEVK